VKYRSAAENYAKMSKFCYDNMCDVLEYKTRFLNPSLVQLCTQELEYYTACSQLLTKLGDLQQRFSDIRGEEKTVRLNYDPYKFIRGKGLINMPGSNTSMNASLLEDKTTLLKERADQTYGFHYNQDIPLKSYQVEGNVVSKDSILSEQHTNQTNQQQLLQQNLQGVSQTGIQNPLITQTGIPLTTQIGMQNPLTAQTGTFQQPLMSGTQGFEGEFKTQIPSTQVHTGTQAFQSISHPVILPGQAGYIPYTEDENYAISESEGEVEEDDFAVSDEGLTSGVGNIHLTTHQGTISKEHPLTTTIESSNVIHSTGQPLGGIIREKPSLQPLEETEFHTFTPGSGQISPKTTQGLSFQEPNLGEQGIHAQQSNIHSSELKQHQISDTTTTQSNKL
jgi:hypothetical protein